MRGLSGDLATMPLKDLLVYLGNRKATGTLRFTRGQHEKEVQLREGEIVSASSNDPREYLGQFLINMGQLTEEQFHQAYQAQKESRILLGKILVMNGAVTEKALLSALSLKLRETLLSVVTWPEGEFHFDRERVPDASQKVELAIELLEVHREAEFRETAWSAIKAAFPSERARLEIDPTRSFEAPPPGSLDQRILELVSQGQRIEELILSLHATDFFVYQRLYALQRLGVIRTVELEPGDEPLVGEQVMGDEASVVEILQHAERFLAEGAYAEAEALAQQAHAMAPSAQTEALLQAAGDGLAQGLRGMLNHGIPRLLVPPSKLKGLPLSAQERYLLSRVDGERTLASIISASPLHEDQALRLFKRFMDSGLIEVG